MICPCKDCTRKGCGDEHDACEKYQAWKTENDKKKKWIRDQMPAVNERAIKGQNKKIMSKSRWIGGKRGTKNYE